MSQEVTPDLQAKVTNELLQEFSQALEVALRGRLSEVAPLVPRETIQLISFEIMEASASDISAKFQLMLQDSGRISEMKTVNRKSMVPLEVIKDWVKRNRSKFKRVPGYRAAPQKLSEEKQIERIAWAVALNQRGVITRRGRKKRERTWLNPTFYGFVNRLIGDFQTRQADLLQRLIKEGLEGLEGPQVL